MDTIIKVIIAPIRKNLLSGHKQFTFRIQQNHQLQITNSEVCSLEFLYKVVYLT
jgi:hypothetical protein